MASNQNMEQMEYQKKKTSGLSLGAKIGIAAVVAVLCIGGAALGVVLGIRSGGSGNSGSASAKTTVGQAYEHQADEQMKEEPAAKTKLINVDENILGMSLGELENMGIVDTTCEYFSSQFGNFVYLKIKNNSNTSFLLEVENILQVVQIFVPADDTIFTAFCIDNTLNDEEFDLYNDVEVHMIPDFSGVNVSPKGVYETYKPDENGQIRIDYNVLYGGTPNVLVFAKDENDNVLDYIATWHTGSTSRSSSDGWNSKLLDNHDSSKSQADKVNKELGLDALNTFYYMRYGEYAVFDADDLPAGTDHITVFYYEYE